MGPRPLRRPIVSEDVDLRYPDQLRQDPGAPRRLQHPVLCPLELRHGAGRARGGSRPVPAPDDEWAGHWASRPESWANLPEERFIAKETRAQIDAPIAALPPAQREVITRRDLEGWTSDEVSQVLEMSEGNQRVLLHRARSKVWRALKHYFKGT